MLTHIVIDSPVGRLKLVADRSSLLAVLWPNDGPSRVKSDETCEDLHHPILREAERQLSEYFGRKRKTFELPMRFIGTAFQTRVWQHLLTIPYGQTRSYGHLAAALGMGAAARAVGRANSKNPLSIIVPCHRVVGVSGKLTGFAGGLETKATLLELESATSNLP